MTIFLIIGPVLFEIRGGAKPLPPYTSPGRNERYMRTVKVQTKYFIFHANRKEKMKNNGFKNEDEVLHLSEGAQICICKLY